MMIEPITLAIEIQTKCKILFISPAYHTHQIQAPIIILVFRPNMSERNPEHKAASHEPPAIDAVIPPSINSFRVSITIQEKMRRCQNKT